MVKIKKKKKFILIRNFAFGIYKILIKDFFFTNVLFFNINAHISYFITYYIA